MNLILSIFVASIKAIIKLIINLTIAFIFMIPFTVMSMLLILFLYTNDDESYKTIDLLNSKMCNFISKIT